MPDHRKLTRWQLDRQAKLTIEQSGRELLCQVKDISNKGVGLILGQKLPHDSGFKLHLKLTQDCHFDAEVWVAWNKVIDGVNHYGLFFSKLRDADKEKIRCFVDTYCTQVVAQKWSPPEIKSGRQGDDLEDQRIFERFNTNLTVRYLNSDTGQEGVARTQDISAKGLNLETRQPLPAHTILEVWLEMKNAGESLYSRGEVVWSKNIGADNYRAGVELEKADLMGISRILRAVTAPNKKP